MSNISRSEYQRVCEANKKLIKDIELLVSPIDFGEKGANKILLINEYREKFKDRDYVKNLINQLLKPTP